MSLPLPLPPRKYEPIWLVIKDKSVAALTADPVLHARIKKGVIKEKDRDLAFKLLASEVDKKYVLKITSKGQLLTFRLVRTNAVSIHDL